MLHLSQTICQQSYENYDINNQHLTICSCTLIQSHVYFKISAQVNKTMKINFEEIFGEDHSSELSTSLNHSLSQHQPLNILQPQPQPYHSMAASQVRKKKPEPFRSNITAMQQIEDLTRLIEQKEQNIVKQRQVDINQLTMKLHTHTECQKQSCQRHRSTRKTQELEALFTTQPLRQSSKPKSVVSADRTSESAATFERLHNLSRISELRKAYIQDQSDQKSKKLNHNRSNRSLIESPYLKNYVPFYERLQGEVNKTQDKIKLMDNNPQFATGKIEKYFKPKLIPSKYSGKILSRYRNEISRQEPSNQFQDFMNSSINTSFSSLNRSQEIVNQVEQHFIKKMQCIFLNEGEEWITVRQSTIALLTDVQFKILQPFIVELEEKAIKNSEFQQKIREYYYKLPHNEKQQLRSHETKKKNKYGPIKRQTLTKKMTKTPPPPKPQPVVKKINKFVGDHRNKIHTYI